MATINGWGIFGLVLITFLILFATMLPLIAYARGSKTLRDLGRKPEKLTEAAGVNPSPNIPRDRLQELRTAAEPRRHRHRELVGASSGPPRDSADH